jgi:hypothetical protein
MSRSCVDAGKESNRVCFVQESEIYFHSEELEFEMEKMDGIFSINA